MERKKITIELADNGIIIREPDCVDVVQLSLYQRNTVEEYSQIYHDLGEILFGWLMEVVLEDYKGPLVAEGFKVEFNAEITGRKRE